MRVPVIACSQPEDAAPGRGNLRHHAEKPSQANISYSRMAIDHQFVAMTVWHEVGIAKANLTVFVRVCHARDSSTTPRTLTPCSWSCTAGGKSLQTTPKSRHIVKHITMSQLRVLALPQPSTSTAPAAIAASSSAQAAPTPAPAPAPASLPVFAPGPALVALASSSPSARASGGGTALPTWR